MLTTLATDPFTWPQAVASLGLCGSAVAAWYFWLRYKSRR
jgi:hypothetical protein